MFLVTKAGRHSIVKEATGPTFLIWRPEPRPIPTLAFPVGSFTVWCSGGLFYPLSSRHLLRLWCVFSLIKEGSYSGRQQALPLLVHKTMPAFIMSHAAFTAMPEKCLFRCQPTQIYPIEQMFNTKYITGILTRFLNKKEVPKMKGIVQPHQHLLPHLVVLFFVWYPYLLQCRCFPLFEICVTILNIEI